MSGYDLTARARDLLTFLGKCEYCPSFEEMRVAVGVTSNSVVHRLLRQLEERGYIRRLPNRARAIEVLHPGHGYAGAASLIWACAAVREPVVIRGETYRFIPKTRAA